MTDAAREPERDAIAMLNRFIYWAITGSPEHGAFGRGSTGEYIPHPIFALKTLEAQLQAHAAEIATLKAKVVESYQEGWRHGSDETLGMCIGEDEQEVVRRLMDEKKQAEAEIAKAKVIIELAQRAYDRLALCPDHRDKTNGTCIVCMAERRTQQEAVAEIARLRAKLTE